MCEIIFKEPFKDSKGNKTFPNLIRHKKVIFSDFFSPNKLEIGGVYP